MKNTWNWIKQFFTFPVVRPYWRAGDGFAETEVVDLTPQERAYVSLQTHRMLLLKRAQQYRRTKKQNWEISLPISPAHASIYEIYNAR